MLQVGREADDWRPMSSIGPGVCEIRVRSETGQFRIIYVARLKSAIYVLHAFQKKSEKTSRTDLRQARRRYRDASAIDSGD